MVIMKPLIPPSFYSDSRTFKREQRLLFQAYWHFAGFIIDLQNHNDYICTEIGGKSVVIQNFHGELRAFHNVCSHRFSQLRQHPQGNASLTCPYHGWTYDREGIPVGIPGQTSFGEISHATRESLKLQRWMVETCGPLIFVKKHDDGVTLRQFLKETYNELEKLSNVLTDKIDVYEVIINANFKVVIENSLEGYHIDSIHSETFGKAGKREFEYFLSNHPHINYTVEFGKSNGIWKKIESIISKSPLKSDKYSYQFVFSGLTFAITRGILFVIQLIYPINSSTTKITSYTFLGGLNDAKPELKNTISDVLSKSFKPLVRAVIDEDKAICEQVQIGLTSTAIPSHL